ncbi:MAG: hypothetical protein DRJ47_02260 [Thermoprotei archaeon]|nr:MAG: hypothetical protein DRJ47_02260 [Thermoprotei archaeon]
MDLSYDFRDEYYKFKGLEFAFRVFTLDNIYGIDPEKTSVEHEGDVLKIVSSGFHYAGRQRKVPGSFKAEIKATNNFMEIRAEASFDPGLKLDDFNLRFEEWKIKSLAVLIKGVEVGKILNGRFEFEDYDRERGVILNYPGEWTTYTKRIPVPLFITQLDEKKYFYALSMEDKVRPKRFAVRRDLDGRTVIELHHEEKATRFTNSIEIPPWRIGECEDPMDVFRERMKFMEERWGLKPWNERPDVPEWMKKVSLVVNMHGKHWTGYVFNTFERMLEILEWIAERIEGYRVLVFIPSFNGRYYYDYPVYDPDPDLGGPEGFRKLVEGAHELGMHVVPMYGAVAAGFRWIRRLGLEDAIIQNKYGWSIVPPNWVDWDADRERDDIWIPVSPGHPKFLEQLFNSVCKVTDEYGVDGAFFDIPHFYVNDARYDFYEGLKTLVVKLKEKYGREFLIFGEYYYDALMPIIPFYHVPFPKNYTEFFHKYIRTTYHLSHPSPGRGSSGVHEIGHLKFFVPDPREKAIPALCVVEDTIPEHAEEVEKVIEAAKEYAKNL